MSAPPRYNLKRHACRKHKAVDINRIRNLGKSGLSQLVQGDPKQDHTACKQKAGFVFRHAHMVHQVDVVIQCYTESTLYVSWVLVVDPAMQLKPGLEQQSTYTSTNILGEDNWSVLSKTP